MNNHHIVTHSIHGLLLSDDKMLQLTITNGSHNVAKPIESVEGTTIDETMKNAPKIIFV